MSSSARTTSRRIGRFLLVIAVSGTASFNVGAQLALPLSPDSPNDRSLRSDSNSRMAQSPLPAPQMGASSLQSRLQTLTNNLSGSTHSTISRNGEKVITLIRLLPKADAETQSALMRRLAAQASDHSPEALTFFAFAAELGLFGIQKQPEKAIALYRVAAGYGYQTAIYDLALGAAYGRAVPRNLRLAEGHLIDALTKGSEASSRVCGMGAFVAYRLGDRAAMQNMSEECGSPLAALANASLQDRPATPAIINQLKMSIAAGVDDGYSILASLGRADSGADTQFTNCHWSLVNRFRAQSTNASLLASARSCVESAASSGSSVASLSAEAKQQAALAIAASVPTELQWLTAARKANSFRYSMSVPYLPFLQTDVDLFAPVLGLGTQPQ